MIWCVTWVILMKKVKFGHENRDHGLMEYQIELNHFTEPEIL